MSLRRHLRAVRQLRHRLRALNRPRGPAGRRPALREDAEARGWEARPPDTTGSSPASRALPAAAAPRRRPRSSLDSRLEGPVMAYGFASRANYRGSGVVVPLGPPTSAAELSRHRRCWRERQLRKPDHPVSRRTIFRAIVERVEVISARTNGRHLPGVRWWSSLGEMTGYGNESRLFLGGLKDRGVAVQARMLPNTVFSFRHPLLDSDERAREHINDPVSGDHLAIVHTVGPRLISDRGGHLVLRTMYETDRVPDGWLRDLRRFDELWVPTEHAQRIFIDAGLDKEGVSVLPQPIDVALFDPDSHQPMVGLPPAGFRFLAVGSWRVRKGWDVLIRAYLEEFTPADDTLLIIHAPPKRKLAAITIRREVAHIRSQVPDPGQHPPLWLSLRTLPTALMPTLYCACDAFVLASRGEGWGRPYMEAMAMGLPTIGTGWGGNRAFMTESNSYLIDYQLQPIDTEVTPHYSSDAGHYWAAPSGDHLRHLMRSVVSNSEEAGRRGLRARRDIAENYSVRHVLDSLLA